MSQVSSIESEFDEAAKQFDDPARAKLLERLLPLLDSAELPTELRASISKQIAGVKKRYARLPDFDFIARKAGIAELMNSLRRCYKLRPGEEGTEERNEITQEMILTLVSWIKQLWIIGVEYGVELEAVHDGLMCCQLTLREVSESPGDCSCILKAFELDFDIKRSDNEVVETFTGPAADTITRTISCVWRDLFFAHLSKPQNKTDESYFVSSRLPRMLSDIRGLRTLGLPVLFKIASGDLFPEETDEDSDYSEDADSEDEAMPALVDVSDEEDEDNEEDENGDDETLPSNATPNIPPLAAVPSTPPTAKPTLSLPDQVGGSKAPAGLPFPLVPDTTLVVAEDHKEAEHSLDGEIEVEAELDEEESLRWNEEDRFQRLVERFIVQKFKDSPSDPEEYKLITKWRPTLKKELLDHLSNDMIHSVETFDATLEILMSEKGVKTIQALIAANPSLAAQAPGGMQKVAVFFASQKAPAVQNLAHTLILKQTREVLESIRVEVQAAFEGLRNPFRMAALTNELLNLPTSSDKALAYHNWVESILTPKVDTGAPQGNIGGGGGTDDGGVSDDEEDEDDEEEEDGVGNLDDPFGIFAGLTAMLGLHPPTQNHTPKIYADPVEGFTHLSPHDPDFLSVSEAYRPTLGPLFDAWIKTTRELVKKDTARFGGLSFKICLVAMEMFPYLRLKLMGLTEEMINRISHQPHRQHVVDALRTLMKFVREQQKLAASKAKKDKAAAANKAKATAGASSSNHTTEPPPPPTAPPLLNPSLNPLAPVFFPYAAGHGHGPGVVFGSQNLFPGVASSSTMPNPQPPAPSPSEPALPNLNFSFNIPPNAPSLFSGFPFGPSSSTTANQPWEEDLD